MNRYYALINNNIVTKVEVLSEEQAQEASKNNSLVIDIEDMVPRPDVNWILQGNILVNTNVNMSIEAAELHQQTTQRLFGVKLLPTAVDKVGARNLKLDREGTPVDIVALSGQMTSIKLLLEGGALKTARMVCLGIKPMFPNHSDILQEVADEITNFLISQGWN